MHDNAVHEHTNHVTRRRVLAAGAVSAVAALTGSSAADGAAKSNQSLKERRLAVVRRHMSTENDDEFAQTLATFRRPRYEFIATGEVDNGRKAVDGYYNSIESAFPDEHTSDWRMRYAPGEDGDRDAVVVEFLFTGTQKRAFMGIPASGRPRIFRVLGSRGRTCARPTTRNDAARPNTDAGSSMASPAPCSNSAPGTA